MASNLRARPFFLFFFQVTMASNLEAMASNPRLDKLHQMNLEANNAKDRITPQCEVYFSADELPSVHQKVPDIAQPKNHALGTFSRVDT